jgi:hypothetical protein
LVDPLRRQDDDDLAFGVSEHVVEPQLAVALEGAPLPERDQLGQPPVRGPIGRKAQQ